MERPTSQTFPGVLETPLQFIFVTSLPNKRYSYHLWLLVITKSGKKKNRNKFTRLQNEVFFLSNIGPPVYNPSPPLPPVDYRPIKSVLCPYIHPRRINAILPYILATATLRHQRLADYISIYRCGSRRCGLCLTEKYITARADQKNVLNKGSVAMGISTFSKILNNC